MGRHVSPTLNLIALEKTRRIDAMDEVKRALDSAEQIPFTTITLHLGLKDEPWDLRALENSLTAIEHVKAFAHPLGVKVLLENLQNDVTTPEHLLEILNVGHFNTVGICLDLGHAHLAAPRAVPEPNHASEANHHAAETNRANAESSRSIPESNRANADSNRAINEAIELLRPRIAALNLHDNNGLRDEHLWPGDPASGIDWTHLSRSLATLPAHLPAILEIAHDLNETPESVTRKTSGFLSTQSRLAEAQSV